MKRYLSLLLLTSILVACESDEDSSSSKQASSGESVALSLTPFGELNQGDSEINSHADDWSTSVLTQNYRYSTEVGVAVTSVDATYSRMLKLADGSYILLCQNRADSGGNGSDVYWATSPDMLVWTGKGKLFAAYATTNSKGNSDNRWYTNGNGLVLSDGTVLIFASYRSKSAYSTYSCRYDHGIEMIMSKDNGQTWSDPYEVHHGPNWEAMMVELASGNLQLYFSESRPWISGSHSGTSMVVSSDGGYTWTPSVDNTDPLRVIRHRWYSEYQDLWLFTDQMPGLILLNDSKQLAGVFESVTSYTADDGKSYCISFAWSPEDGEWENFTEIEGDGSSFDVESASIGPEDRAIDVWTGAGPDLEQFPSGETVVSYAVSSYMYMRIGDSEARNWNDAFKALSGKGSWGSMCMDSGHEIIATMRNSSDSDNPTIAMVKYSLNHRIQASTHPVTVDGDNSEWSNTDEALFVGAACQALATLRCAVDSDYVYFLVESLDENVSTDDYAQIFLAPTDLTKLGSRSFRIKFGPNGLRNAGYYAGGWIEDDFGANVYSCFDATLSDSSDTDNGWLAEVSVPRSSLEIYDGKLLVNFALFDMVGGEDAIISTGVTNPQSWMTISGL